MTPDPKGDPITFLVPGPLDARTGGYEYDRQMVRALQARGLAVELIALDRSFPAPTPTAHASCGAAARPACPTARSRSLTGWRSACCRTKPRAKPRGCDWWRWCITRWRWKPARRPNARRRCSDSETRALRSASLIVVTSAADRRACCRAFGVAAECVPGGRAGHRAGAAGAGIRWTPRRRAAVRGVGHPTQGTRGAGARAGGAARSVAGG